MQTPGLADQLAQLRSATTAAEKHAWLPDAVFELIMACLARIFGRLEHLVLLWQTGHLPLRHTTCADSTCAPRHPATRTYSAHPNAAHPHIHARHTRAAITPTVPGTIALIRTPNHAATVAAPIAATVAPGTCRHLGIRIRPGRAPPHTCGQPGRAVPAKVAKNAISASRTRVLNVTF